MSYISINEVQISPPPEAKKIVGTGQRICWSSSGYKGVYFDKRGRKKPWTAYTGTLSGAKRSCHFTAEQAAQAYDEAAREIYGPDARVNFPLNGERKVLAKEPRRCGHGHEMTDANTYHRPDGQNLCRACQDEAEVRSRHRQLLKRRQLRLEKRA